MSDTTAQVNALKESILSKPEFVLEDPDLMRALAEANERALGSNIVDLRGIAMARLEERLDRLEDTHRTVIAAAYDNLAGTQQIHRAILRMLEPTDFPDFVRDLAGDVSDILGVDAMRLVLEGSLEAPDPRLEALGDVLLIREPGFVDAVITGGRQAPARKVTLRQTGAGDEAIYGAEGAWIRSEACLKLQFGAGRLPGLLCLGAEDPHLFTPAQGTDLMSFFAGAVERAIRRWLA